MKLDYVKLPARRRSRELSKLALATSLAAVACLGASAGMYTLLGTTARELQQAIALTSAFLEAIALITSGVAMALNPRGGREIAALSTAIAYALFAVAAMKYL